MEEFKVYQAKIYSILSSHPPGDMSAVAAMVEKLIKDANATADWEEKLGRPHWDCQLMRDLATELSDHSNPATDPQWFNYTFSNLQMQVNNWTLTQPKDLPKELPWPRPQDKQPVASNKAFISAKNPEELLVEAHAMKTEIFKNKKPTSNPNLHKWMEKLAVDAFQVAEKYPGSNKMDAMMELTHQVQDGLKKHPHNDQIFKERFDHLYSEIKNWSKGE